MKKQLCAAIISGLLLLGASHTPDVAAMEFTHNYYEGSTYYKGSEHSSWGQSFVATDADIGSIAINMHTQARGALSMEVYRGEGMSGELLLRAVDSEDPFADDLIDSTSSHLVTYWISLDTTEVAFEAGQTYSLIGKINEDSQTFRTKIMASTSPDYEEGHFIVDGAIVEGYDAPFMVRPHTPITEIPVALNTDVRMAAHLDMLDLETGKVYPYFDLYYLIDSLGIWLNTKYDFFVIPESNGVSFWSLSYVPMAIIDKAFEDVYLEDAVAPLANAGDIATTDTLDPNKTVLIRTYEGTYYKIGNISKEYAGIDYTWWLDWDQFKMAYHYTFDYQKLEPRPIEIPVDIKATSCPNPLNVKSEGVLPVAILGTADLDVSQIDPSSVSILGVSPVDFSYEDVSTPYTSYIGKEHMLDCNTLGADGFTDLSMHFDRQEILAAIQNVAGEELVDGKILTLPLSAYLLEEFDGTELKGEDVIILRGTQFSVKETKTWSKKYCAEIEVTNVADTDSKMPYGVDFTLPLDTEFTDTWNGEISRDGENVTVMYPDPSEMMGPAIIGPGETAAEPFGYCASGKSKPANLKHVVPDFSEVETGYDIFYTSSVVTETTDSGDIETPYYCASVMLTYNGVEPYLVHPKQVSFTFPEETYFESFYPSYTPFTRKGDKITIDSPPWAESLYPGVTTGSADFCVVGTDVPSNFVIEQ